MKKTIALLLTLFGIVIVTQSCFKNNDPVQEEKTMEDLKVPDGFTYETTTEKSLTIRMPESVSFEDLRSRFDVYSADPDAGGHLITAGSFDENGEFNGTLKIPTTLTSIYVKTIAGNIIVDLDPLPSLKDDGVIIDFGEDYGYTDPDTRDEGTKSYRYTNIVGSFRSGSGLRSNMVGNADFETNDFGVISSYQASHPIDSRWHMVKYKKIT